MCANVPARSNQGTGTGTVTGKQGQKQSQNQTQNQNQSQSQARTSTKTSQPTKEAGRKRGSPGDVCVAFVWNAKMIRSLVIESLVVEHTKPSWINSLASAPASLANFNSVEAMGEFGWGWNWVHVGE